MDIAQLNLRKRFVSDFQIPICIFDDPYFNYFIDLYQDYFESRTKWNNLAYTIHQRFNSNPNLFLEEYAHVRDNIINDLLTKESYIKFNSSELKEYDIPNNNYSSSNVYKETNDGKIFISIDLKKANYQALKHVGVVEEDSYYNFIDKYTNLQYIKESKYTRQVIFGKLNPKKQIKVEKFLINKVLNELINDNLALSNDVVSFCTDEIVLDASNMNIGEEMENNLHKFIHKIKTQFDINVDIEIYKLHLVTFETYNGLKQTIYKKEFMTGIKEDELMTVPSFYFAQIYKLINKQKLREEDLLFYMENQLATFKYPLTLKDR